MSELKPIPGARDETNRQYHSESDYLNHSALDVFIESVPQYYGRYIAKTIPAPKETDALALGSAFHALVLEPDRAGDLVFLDPAGHRNSTAYKDARRELEASIDPAGVIVKVDQYDQARRMADSVLAHPQAKEILAVPGWCEQSVYVELPDIEGRTETLFAPGKFKTRFDKLFPSGAIVDLKSTRHVQPEQIAKQFAQLGYGRQSGHYEMVRDIAMGGNGNPDNSIFWYIVTCSVPPFETIVFELDPIDRNWGRLQNVAAIKELNACRENDTWGSRYPGIRTLSLPGWARKEKYEPSISE